MAVSGSAAVAFVVGNAGAIAATAAVVSAGVTIAGTIQKGQDDKKALASQEAAQQQQQAALAAQSRAQSLQEAAQRTQLIRQQRLQRAATIQAGVASGAGGNSSGVQGAVSSIGSQGANNVSFLDTQFGLTETANSDLSAASAFSSEANKYISKGNSAGAVANVGLAGFKASGGLGAFSGASQGLYNAGFGAGDGASD